MKIFLRLWIFRTFSVQLVVSFSGIFSPNWLCQHFLHCNNYSSSHVLQAFSITFHLVLNVIDIQLYRSHIFLSLFFFYLLSFPILDKHGPCSSLQFSFEFRNQTWILSLVLWSKKLVMFPNKICICYSL